MSTHAIIALKNELKDATAALKRQQADSAEAITLGQRAQAVVDSAQRKVDSLGEAIEALEKIEQANQHPAEEE